MNLCDKSVTGKQTTLRVILYDRVISVGMTAYLPGAEIHLGLKNYYF